MYSDLIKRGDVLDTLEKVFNKYNMAWGDMHRGFAEDVPNAVKKISAAYDFESVIGQLEEKALEHAINGQQYGEDGYDIHETAEQGIKEGIEIAIDILKSCANATNGKNGG